MRRLSEMTAWEAATRTLYLYFSPLTKKWFWCYLFPPIVVFSMVMAYYDVYVKEGCYAQRLQEMQQKQK